MTYSKEMEKFVEILKKRKVEYEDKTDSGNIMAGYGYGIIEGLSTAIERVHFEHDGINWSVVHGYGTYGGWNGMDLDEGLLEAWDMKNDPVGWLTAGEAELLIFKGKTR